MTDTNQSIQACFDNARDLLRAAKVLARHDVKQRLARGWGRTRPFRACPDHGVDAITRSHYGLAKIRSVMPHVSIRRD